MAMHEAPGKSDSWFTPPGIFKACASNSRSMLLAPAQNMCRTSQQKFISRVTR